MIIQSSPLPEFATIQSGVDSNLNSDTAGDRAVINASGAANVGSGVTGYNAQGRAVAAGDLSIVAYVANNPMPVTGLPAWALMPPAGETRSRLTTPIISMWRS